MNNGASKDRIRLQLAACWHFLCYLQASFRANQGTLNAAALTYTTLFAVVPLMTVTYAMLASIPSFQGVSVQLENLIFNHFVPSSGVAVRDYLSQFASQARTLTAVGVGFLVVTAFLMLRSIEAAFNRIWRVRKPRKGMASFLLYWAVLSLGPLLLGLGFVLTSYLISLPLISDATEVLGTGGWLFKLLPVLSSAAAFTLIYAAVPNCPVKIRHALAGGLLVALLFEGAKQGFTLFVRHFPSYELIYGAFAAVPLFLAWVFISWVIILLGAELVRAQSAYRGRSTRTSGQHLVCVLMILELLWQAQKKGRARSAVEVQRALPDLDQSACDDYLNELLQVAVITRTEQGEYLLARDLHSVTLLQLCQLLPWKLPDMTDGVQRPWVSELSRHLQAVTEFRHQQLAVDLASLFGKGGSAIVVPTGERPGLRSL